MMDWKEKEWSWKWKPGDPPWEEIYQNFKKRWWNEFWSERIVADFGGKPPEPKKECDHTCFDFQFNTHRKFHYKHCPNCGDKL